MFDKFYGNKKSLNNKIFGQEKVYLNKGIFLKKQNQSTQVKLLILSFQKNIKISLSLGHLFLI